ncbi:MAG: hypothetical protein U0939_24155 [Pirellulales bacterium]
MDWRSVVVAGFLCLGWQPPIFGQLAGDLNGVEIDGVRLPIGSSIEVEGLGCDRKALFHEWAHAAIDARRINGKATQEKLLVHLYPFQAGDKSLALRTVEKDASIRVQGQLTDVKVGGAENILVVRVQRLNFVGSRPLSPSEFVGRVAAFEGDATSDGCVQVQGLRLQVDSVADWPADVRGKRVSVRGVIRRETVGAKTIWYVEQPRWKLFHLQDQVDRQVELEGVLRAHNGVWWFEYPDNAAAISLTSDEGPSLQFGSDDFRRRVRVTGKLRRQLRPPLPYSSPKGRRRDLEMTYVIRGAKVVHLDPIESTADGRRYTFAEPLRTTNGVPELRSRGNTRPNFWGHETEALLGFERNAVVIKAILESLTPETRDVLAKRMQDSDVDEICRLIYASILASVNDARGRAYLIKAVDTSGPIVDCDALYCLAIVPFLGNDQQQQAVDMSWAESKLIDVITNSAPKRLKGARHWDKHEEMLPLNHGALIFTKIADALAARGSAPAQKALIAATAANPWAAWATWAEENKLAALLRWQVPLDSEELLQMESIDTDPTARSLLFESLIRQPTPRALRQFLPDLNKDPARFYHGLRDANRIELVDALKAIESDANDEVREITRLLAILLEPDPIPELIRQLDAPRGIRKSLVMLELRRYADSRAVKSLARLLREAPPDYFRQERLDRYETSNAIENALEAIAFTGTSEAIHELTRLFEADFSRFGSDLDNADYGRLVAEHLIELTGESFGLDVAAWKKWQMDHPQHSVPRERANRGL